MLKISNQQLVATFVDSNLATTTFATGLSIPANTWSKVQVDYDQNTIKFTVTANGTPSSYTQTFSKHALYYGECVFGGLLKGMAPGDQYFQGLLKSFRVVHNVLP